MVKLFITSPNIRVNIRDRETGTALECITAQNSMSSLVGRPLVFNDIIRLLRNAENYVNHLNNLRDHIVRRISSLEKKTIYLDNLFQKIILLLKVNPEFINLGTNSGQTILHSIVIHNLYSSGDIKFIYNCGAKLDIKDEEGNTPLHLADLLKCKKVKNHPTNIVTYNNCKLSMKDVAEIALIRPEYIPVVRKDLSDEAFIQEAEIKELRNLVEKENINTLKKRVYSRKRSRGFR